MTGEFHLRLARPGEEDAIVQFLEEKFPVNAFILRHTFKKLFDFRMIFLSCFLCIEKVFVPCHRFTAESFK